MAGTLTLLALANTVEVVAGCDRQGLPRLRSLPPKQARVPVLCTLHPRQHWPVSPSLTLRRSVSWHITAVQNASQGFLMFIVYVCFY